MSKTICISATLLLPGRHPSREQSDCEGRRGVNKEENGEEVEKAPDRDKVREEALRSAVAPLASKSRLQQLAAR